MPILAPLSVFAHVSRSLRVTAWNAVLGWMNLCAFVGSAAALE
jgi:uncharacterized ion transporter superfamily protein YfcC